MKTRKHSYVLAKDGFILCVLLNTEHYYAGEILYGQEPIENCPIKQIGGKKYFKYWFLQSADRKLRGSLGEETNYSNYYERVAAVYRDFSFRHPLVGNLFKIDRDRVKKLWTPLKFDYLDRHNLKQKFIVEKLSSLLNIGLHNIDLGGSNILDPNNISKNDFDIILNSKESSTNMVNQIRRLTKDPVYWERTNDKHIHHRRFILNSIKICPFGISDDDEIFENSPYNLVKSNLDIDAIVLDDSDSLLSPARYKIMIDDDVLNLISYNVGHIALLKIGYRIKLRASRYIFTIDNKSVPAIVIPIEGTWIEIN